jgi:hypothetical protein
MRTKTLLLSAAALGAAGLITTSAQVYSVNAVGYINVAVPTGFSLIANQLNHGNNTLGAVLPTAPDGTTVYKFTGTGYEISTFDELDAAWSNPNITMAPGEGAFIRNSGAAAFTLTFVGEVPQGNLSNTLPQGFSIRSSQVPQAGRVTTDLGLPANDGDTIYQFRSGGFVINSFDELDNAWGPAEPNVAVGESFFLRRAAAGNWARNFNVNQ